MKVEEFQEVHILVMLVFFFRWKHQKDMKVSSFLNEIIWFFFTQYDSSNYSAYKSIKVISKNQYLTRYFKNTKYKISCKLLVFWYYYLNIFVCRIIRGIILCKKSHTIPFKKVKVTFISFRRLHLEKNNEQNTFNMNKIRSPRNRSNFAWNIFLYHQK